MSGLPPVDLSAAFGAPRAKTDLGTLLPPKPTVTVTPDKPAEAAPTAKRPRGSRPTTPARPAPSTAHRRRGVIVYVTVEQRDWIRQHVGAGRTTTDVVLDAIETHLEDLHPEPAPATTGLFTRAAAPATEPGVQLHLRLTGGNLQVLDKVVADKGFPSRSALIRAAVQAAVRA